MHFIETNVIEIWVIMTSGIGTFQYVAVTNTVKDLLQSTTALFPSRHDN